MRNRQLHDALREFALEAAAHLTHELQQGAEIPFEVVEEPAGRGHTVLYNYRPLTSEFIGARWGALRQLPACGPAVEALGSGAENYLRLQAGASAAADSEPALVAMLERIYEEATSFDFPEERFERVYADVERALYQDVLRTAVVAPLYGVTMAGARLDLGDGMFLVSGDKLDAPAAAVWSDADGVVAHGREPNVLCVLRRDVASEAPLPVAEARGRFRTLLTAMRLLKPGRAALGAVAWARIDEGAWQPLPLPLGAGDGVSRGGSWDLDEAEGPELVELVELLAGGAPAGRVGWALGRFESGCGRALDVEALSDYLLALEALLDGRDEAGRATLTLRLAALCAEDGERRAVQRRAELAFALERWVMGGGGANAYLEALGPDTPRSLVLDLEQHLRALLRDVLCGYLGTDLKAAADDVLLTSSEPLEIRAADLRREDEAPGPEAAGRFGPGAAGRFGPEAAGRFGPGAAGRFAPEPLASGAVPPAPDAPPAPVAPEPVAAEPGSLPVWPQQTALVVEPLGPERVEPLGPELAVEPAPETVHSPEPAPPAREPVHASHAAVAGVTESADWDWDDDPDSYSAPI